MRVFLWLLTAALLFAPILSLLIGTGAGDGLLSTPRPQIRPPAELVRPRVAIDSARQAAVPSRPPPVFTAPGEDELLDRAARLAWRYVESQSHPTTGLVNSVARYPYATVWDMASGLAATYCARELGLIGAEEYDRRIGLALRTLRTLRLFDGAVFNKNYQIARAIPAGRHNRERPPRPDGYGWSAIDVGRLLVWLKIIAVSDPQHATAATAVVRRIDFERLISDGYLRGETLDRRGRPQAYQEGRIGYEQYAAAGFALWDQRAERALDWAGNVREIDLYGAPLLVDRREGAYLTSEPFLLLGLELGWWDPAWKVQAERVLAAQAARHRRTGQITMVSEDALPVPPDFFYYYTVYDDGEPFAVRTLGSRVPDPEPRWVSTKAAFAWYALMPGPYTWKVVQAVTERAGDPKLGWSSGFYERSGKATGSQNVNTAAVVLEAALYHQLREPLAMRRHAAGDSVRAGAVHSRRGTTGEGAAPRPE